METQRKSTACAVAAGLLLMAVACPPALAYRPFDGTDASVADDDEFELELGPLGRLREGGEHSWLGPTFVANWGLAHDRELVLEGKIKTLSGDLDPGVARTSLVDTALSLKQLHRRGSLQDGGTGWSIASECGILLPEIHGESRTGATCAGIISQRWDAGTVHVNAALSYNRQHTWRQFFGGIVEGPAAWTVRPVAELFTEHEAGGTRTHSALAGLIWRAHENLSLDVGMRSAKSGDEHVREIRAGLTWSMSFKK